MTLFVDTTNSQFHLIHCGHTIITTNLFKKDCETFLEKFNNSNLSAVVFKNSSSDIGNGLIIFRPSSKDPLKSIVHIRCTSQTSESQCLLLKVDISLNISLLESVKSKSKRILEALGIKFDSLKSVSSSKMKKNIVKMDSDLNLNRFKFGIAYLDRFDTSEQQMLANTIEDSATSKEFSAFLHGLGNEISLKGWKGFSGGLDVSEEGLTGDRAIYKKLNDDSEIIYHVAPWLPQTNLHDENNLERKRHFGNDTIVIIYSESLYAFEMQTLLSRQTQIVLFVRFLNRLQKFEIHIYSKLPELVIEANPIYMENNGILLSFQLSRAAEAERFYHTKAADEIECALSTQEIYLKLDMMNSDSRFFEIARNILEPKDITEYVIAQKKISTLLLKIVDIDFKNDQMRTFAEYLLKSVELNPEKFDDTKIFEVLSILFASGTSENSFRIRKVFQNSIPGLKLLQKFRIFKSLIRFASSEVCFLIPEIVKDSFASQNRIDNFLNDFIFAVFRTTPVSSEVVFMIFKIVLESKTSLNNCSSELLLKGLKNSISGLENDDKSEFLTNLAKFTDHIGNDTNLYEIIVDIILKPKVVEPIRSEELNVPYLNLMHKCSMNSLEYFKAQMTEVDMSIMNIISDYCVKIKLYVKALICIRSIKNLNSNSSETLFKLGLSSAKHLREIFKKCPKVVTSIPNLSELFRISNIALVDVISDNRHEFNLVGLEIMAYLSLIDFEICRDAAIAGNVSYAIGHLLVYIRDPSEFPTQLLTDLKANLDDIIKGTVATRRVCTIPISAIELSADLHVVQFHDSESVIKEATDQLCYSLLISMPIKALGYAYVQDMKETDEMGIARAGFAYFWRKYHESPVQEDVRHFKKYFDHLVQKRFLSKTEIIFIRKYFNNFF